ncbi:hypothetical protein EH228_14985 [Erwinia endophytica]|nr:hypothetical protein [Erwinia endophytica]KAB8307303.1 hypothetical protein EH228_14985 [Erwinia endophytica]
MATTGRHNGNVRYDKYIQRVGEFPLNDFITHTMPQEVMNRAFALMHKGTAIHSVALFNT